MLNHYCVYFFSSIKNRYIKLRHPQNKITCQSDKKSGDVPTQHICIIYTVACNTVGSPTGSLKPTSTSFKIARIFYLEHNMQFATALGGKNCTYQDLLSSCISSNVQSRGVLLVQDILINVHYGDSIIQSRSTWS